MTADWDTILRTAKRQTDNSFAAKVSSLTRLTDDEIKDITPNPGDKEMLARLMSIVADASTDNDAKAQAISSVNGMLQIVIPLLKKFL